MTPLTEIAQTLVRSVLRPGDVAIDATVGNGFDTQFLAECVGPKGKVYGFDIQPVALQTTSKRLDAAGLRHVTLFLHDHADMCQSIPQGDQAAAIMWNLGYLPGGDKRLKTNLNSTLPAIHRALPLLAHGGIMTVVAYTGHAGGADEAHCVAALLKELASGEYRFSEPSPVVDRIDPPRLFVVRRDLAAP